MTILDYDVEVSDVHQSMLPISVFAISWFVALLGWWVLEALLR